MKDLKQKTAKERENDDFEEVPEYAHPLEEEITLKPSKGMVRFLQAHFRASWDDMMAHESHPYWLGESMRVDSRYKTVWKVKTAEEAADLANQLKHFTGSGAEAGLIGYSTQNRKAADRVFQELKGQIDAKEVEDKLENTEYIDIMEVFE